MRVNKVHSTESTCPLQDLDYEEDFVKSRNNN